MGARWTHAPYKSILNVRRTLTKTVLFCYFGVFCSSLRANYRTTYQQQCSLKAFNMGLFKQRINKLIKNRQMRCRFSSPWY